MKVCQCRSRAGCSASRWNVAERAPVYDFAARLLSSEIETATSAAISADPLRAIFDQARPGFADWAGGGFDDARREALAEEFARLFLVPGVVPPFASRWVVQLIGEETTREKTRAEIASLVALACEGLGLDTNAEGPGGRLPPDHAALVFAIASAAAKGELIPDGPRTMSAEDIAAAIASA